MIECLQYSNINPIKTKLWLSPIKTREISRHLLSYYWNALKAQRHFNGCMKSPMSRIQTIVQALASDGC